MRTEVVKKKAQLLIKNTGITNWPIDVEIIAKQMDVEVIEAALPDETSGILEKTQSGKNTIFVNKAHAPVRKRFTIAHEIGHYLFSSREGIYIDKTIFFRDGKSQQAIDDDEMAANSFAAELLMPKHLIKRALNKFVQNGIFDSGEDLVQKMADEFKVSTTAMSIKLQNMGLSF